jgi:Ca2+-binding EF-hand superfamily protein
LFKKILKKIEMQARKENEGFDMQSGTHKPLVQIVFEKYDKDGSGFITDDELASMCYDLGHYFNEKEMAMALGRLDRNHDGKLSYDEFVPWWKQVNRFESFNLTPAQEQMLSNVVQYFKFFDTDQSGALNASEFVYLHADLIKNGFGHHLKGLEQDGDGQVNFNEYVGWLFSIGAIKG